MTGLVGQAMLVAGLLAAASAAYWWLVAARTQGEPVGRNHWMGRRLGRGMTWAMLASAAGAVGALEFALLTHDFSVRYVADNGGQAVPTYYTAISLWADLEGSLLLWLLVLTGYAAAVMRRVPARAQRLHPWAMSTLAAVAAFFFGLALLAGNAFHTVTPIPSGGDGPNPLLQMHPLMGVHPPLLYLGYVGLTVPFAYAVAALATGQTGGAWVAVTRRWTLFAWICLTLAIVMGAWWSYEVLGWGGYWAWDPVENASIIPWFVATALLHSMMAQSRRATLRVWNLVLAMAAFLLALIGTFLTRSNVIQSVHSFTQSEIGPILLGFILAVLVGSGALLLVRADRLGPDEGLGGGLSRESVFLGNNVLLVALALTVLVGTIFPLLVEAATGTRISVGAPYFNRMTIPLALAVVALMGVGPLVPWGKADPRALLRRLTVPGLVGLGVTGGLGLAGLPNVTALVTFGLAGFVLTAMAVLVWAEAAAAVTRSHRGGQAGAALLAGLKRRRRFYGGLVIHAGVVLAAVAIAASQAYTTETQRELTIGDTITVSGYTARLESIDRHRNDRKMWVAAQLELSRGGRSLGTQQPALNFFPSTTEAIGTPAVRSGPAADAYLVLVQADPQGQSAVVNLSVRPLVPWLWVSAAVMAVGAAIAGWPPRRPRRPTEAPDTDTPRALEGVSR